MALMERFFPIAQNDGNFFDSMKTYMEQDFKQMEQQMETMQQYMDRQMSGMRNRMFQLLPVESSGGVIPEIQPKVPIVEEKGETKLKLEFNVNEFKPEEVEVKVLGNNILQVHAKSDVKTDKGETHRMYVRQYSLPDGVDTEKIKPMLSKDGILTIEAPAPKLKPSEKLIPIQYNAA